MIETSAYVRSRHLADQGLRALNSDSFNVCSLNAPFILGYVPGIPLPHLEVLVQYAAGRLEDMGVGIRCLLTDDRDEAMELATELDALNHVRRNRQEKMQQQAVDQLDELLGGLEGAQLPAGLCLYDAAWHQGIVGLVASRIKDSVHRPVFAFAPESEGSDVLKGSARSVSGLHIRDVLARIDALHPHMIPAFGGHAMAAGLSLQAENLETFRSAFDAAVAEYKDQISDVGYGSAVAVDVGLFHARRFGTFLEHESNQVDQIANVRIGAVVIDVTAQLAATEQRRLDIQNFHRYRIAFVTIGAADRGL